MAEPLTSVEARVLGCLLEKERVTPENYPLSLHSLAAACNQSTNRDPVVGFDEATVEKGLDGLRAKKLATMVWSAGARVQKFRHNLRDVYNLEPAEVALITVLLLRGPQTLGELRTRTDRLHTFASLGEVETYLGALGQGDAPLVRHLPARSGQKERRFVQLLTGEPDLTESEMVVATGPGNSPGSRQDHLEVAIAELQADLQSLRAEFAAFRKQFE